MWESKKHNVYKALMTVKEMIPQSCFVSKHCTSIQVVIVSEESLRKGRPHKVNAVQAIIFLSRVCSLKWISSSYTSHVTNTIIFPKECEDLRKENKFLSNEIHMERLMMRTENELTMRNLRNLNQELQAQVKEVRPNSRLRLSFMRQKGQCKHSPPVICTADVSRIWVMSKIYIILIYKTVSESICAKRFSL